MQLKVNCRLKVNCTQEKCCAGLPNVCQASPNFILQLTFDLQFTFSCNSLVHDPGPSVPPSRYYLLGSFEGTLEQFLQVLFIIRLALFLNEFTTLQSVDGELCT